MQEARGACQGASQGLEVASRANSLTDGPISLFKFEKNLDVRGHLTAPGGQITEPNRFLQSYITPMYHLRALIQSYNAFTESQNGPVDPPYLIFPHLVLATRNSYLQYLKVKAE